jgi:heme/copper-type cytochrome/quinol oxidase subunit 4
MNIDKEIDNSIVITYDFTPNKQLKVGQTSQIDDFNIYPSKTIQMDKVDYTPKIGFLTSPIHAIENDDGDELGHTAEFLIEHRNSSGEKMYFCIPLIKQTSASSNNITKIINAISSGGGTIPFNLEQDLYTDLKVIKHKKGNDTFLVLTTPLYVSSLPTNLISSFGQITVDKYQIVNLHSDDQIYIDCNPTGVSSETIAAYNVPINSAYTSEQGKSDYQKQAVYMGLFTFVLILTYFIVPWFYRTYIIESLINWYDHEDMEGVLTHVKEADKKKNIKGYYSAEERLNNINMIILAIALIYILINFIYGIVEGSSDLINATYFSIWFAIAYLSIVIKGENKLFMYHISEIDPEIKKQLHVQYYSEGNTNEFDDKAKGKSSIYTIIVAFSKAAITIFSMPISYPFAFLIVLALAGLYLGLSYGLGSADTEGGNVTKTVLNTIIYSTVIVGLLYLINNRKPNIISQNDSD